MEVVYLDKEKQRQENASLRHSARTRIVICKRKKKEEDKNSDLKKKKKLLRKSYFIKDLKESHNVS